LRRVVASTTDTMPIAAFGSMGDDDEGLRVVTRPDL